MGEDRAAILRILDANLNRAREGLRVMEDAARFALDDAQLSASLKDLRHALRSATQDLGLDRADLLAGRDTPGDVGVSISTPAESDRADLVGVAAAAGARTGEALRSLEEASKALAGSGPGSGSAFEAIRYRLYDAERTLGLALRTPRAPQWAVCVLITESLCARPWREVAEAAVSGGAGCLQLREKDLCAREIVSRARELVAIAAGRAHVIVNDRVDLALAAGADGVHLGQTDMDPADARGIAGSRLLIGVSTANLDQARAAARAGADYVGLGPVFPSGTKPKPELAGLDYVRAFLADDAAGHLPHLAISGIAEHNCAELADAGARGVAVSSAVCGSDDPERAVRALTDRMRA